MNEHATLLTVLTIYGGIAVFAFIVVLLDSIARRRDADRHKSAHAQRPSRPTSS